MTDIIFIAFQFPPLSVGGAFRPLGFAENLPENNIRPHVYCLSPKDYDHVYRPYNSDENLARELQGKDVVIRYVPCDSVWEFYETKRKRFYNIYFNLYRGNEYKKWGKYLSREIKKDALKTDFKAVVVTAPPFGMLRLAKEIAAELKLPLIIDMRDAWTFWNLNGYGTYFHFLANKRLERKYLEAADKIIATSQQTIDDWLSIHPDRLKKKMHCITNGFDAADESFIKSEITIPALSERSAFTIAYVGSFYYAPESRANMLLPFYKREGIKKLQYFPRKQDWLYRTPYFFFLALNKMFKISPELRDVVSVKFAGNKQDWLMEMVRDLGLEENVEFHPYLSREDSLSFQQSADALLLTSAKVYGGRDCFIAGKTFEYFKLQKPILAFVSPGSQKDILNKSRMALYFNPDNVTESAKLLSDLINRGTVLRPDKEYLSQFSRRKLTEKFSNIIKESISQ